MIVCKHNLLLRYKFSLKYTYVWDSGLWFLGASLNLCPGLINHWLDDYLFLGLLTKSIIIYQISDTWLFLESDCNMLNLHSQTSFYFVMDMSLFYGSVSSIIHYFNTDFIYVISIFFFAIARTQIFSDGKLISIKVLCMPA